MGSRRGRVGISRSIAYSDADGALPERLVLSAEMTRERLDHMEPVSLRGLLDGCVVPLQRVEPVESEEMSVDQDEATDVTISRESRQAGELTVEVLPSSRSPEEVQVQFMRRSREPAPGSGGRERI